MSETAGSPRIPGYRRRIVIEPADGAVLAMLEDDMHCLAVILRHENGIVRGIEIETERMPWDSCPGAAAKLVETFEGQALSEVTARRDKKANCTHLHDLAVLAAAHAGDSEATRYDIRASDPVGGERVLEIGRDGAMIMRWVECDGVLASPDALAGRTLLNLRDWIGSLSGVEQEAARLLQWASLVAHGRTMPMEEQSRAAALPPNCYTFQPERAASATRINFPLDFSNGSRVPLGEFGDRMTKRLKG